MATGAEAIIRVVDTAGIPPTTVDRTAAFLQRARRDLWPVSGKGGGKAAVHVELHHLVNLIFGLAAEQPSDAEAAVGLLRGTLPPSGALGGKVPDPFRNTVSRLAPLPSLDDYDGTEDGEAKINAGAWDEALLKGLTAASQQEREEFVRICKEQKAELTMCLAPASVALSWIGPDQCREEFRFSKPDTPLDQIVSSPSITARRRRLTSFPVTILVVAAELVADTWRRRSADLPFPPSGSNPGSESASDRPGSEAPTRTNQPRNRATGQCNSPKTKHVCVGQQAHSGSRGVLQLMKEPPRHGARSPIPLGLGPASSGAETQPEARHRAPSP